MATTIRVTTNTLKQKAEELRNLNTRFKNEVAGLNDRETALAAMWEGEAQKVFHGEFQKDKMKFDQFYTGIEKYIQQLIATAEAYDKAESQNVSIAQSRKA